MKRFLGLLLAGATVIAGVAAAPAADAATGAAGAPEADKPLGTLWYPGPYVPAPAAPATATPRPGPAAEPAPPPAPDPRPAPAVPPTPPPVGAPEADKPLGTLWYPGQYDPGRPADRPAPALAIDPGPAPAAQPPLPAGKPLGTLWYPGPYDPNAPSGPVAVPETPPRPQPTPLPAVSAGGPAAAPTGQPATAAPTPGPPPAARATGEPSPEIPVHLSADTMSFDQETGFVTANGNVVIVHGGRRLVANTVTYDQNNDLVTAKGDVQLTEPNGERIFADRMAVSGDLKDAVVESIGMILTDRSRIAATGGRRSGGVVTELSKGVYSPCNLCADDPTRPPLWQVKAVKVIHDKNTKTIEYRDAWLEVKGVPVFYTPYFAHPDPSVKRKSGFLAPSFGGSSDLGVVVKVPYYFALSPYADATVTALATGEEGSGLIGSYRRRFSKGRLDLDASLVGGDSEEDVRGHVFGEGRFDIDDTWRWGFDVGRATDDTYLRRYGFNSPDGGDTLRSRLFAEGFRKRNYFAINAYTFQGLRAEDDPGLEPLVVPLMDYNHVGVPDRFGGQTVLDINLLSLTRSDGANTHRLSIRPGWQLPFIGPLGDAYKLTFGLNMDLYYAEDLERTGKSAFTGFTDRVIPQVTLDWRFPFVKDGDAVSQTIEPVFFAAYSPYGGNPDTVPNEDSVELEFDDTNLFSANKFTGLDRVEGGPRIGYGLKWGLFGEKGGSSSFFIGQSWRPKEDDTFAVGSGLEEKFSDIVGRVRISPGPHMNLVYRTRFASDNLSQRRNEVAFAAGVPALRFNTNYVFIEQQQDSEFAGREEISFNVASQMDRFWRANFSGVRDMAAGEMRRIRAQLIYENECVILTTDASRTFFKDRDLEPTDQITFNVVLKTLGEIRTDVYQR